jgi:FAD:protein FMN transferase
MAFLNVKKMLLACFFYFLLNYSNQYFALSGATQGTTYAVKYEGQENYQMQIDSILAEVDQQLSLWNPRSDLVAINQGTWTTKVPKHVGILYDLSQTINKKTNGYFDVSIGPIIRFYGFHSESQDNPWKSPPTQLVGKIKLDKNQNVLKLDKDASFDFNAIAQGYTVDLIVAFLESKKSQNYLVEIGGEIRGKGKNQQNEVWKIGIENPKNQEELLKIIPLADASIATSGSYHNFKIKNGKKLSHVIDPKTGLGVGHSLLSITVKAKTTAEADAYATAFLAMGLEKSKVLSKKLKLKIYAIYDHDGNLETYKSDDFEL